MSARFLGATTRAEFSTMFLCGFTVLMGLQVFWLYARTFFNDPFLSLCGSMTSGVITIVVLFVASFIVGFVGLADISVKFFRVVAFYAGVFVAVPIAMLLVSLLGESSNLWPIALVMAWIEVAVLIAVGGFMGFAIKKGCAPKSTSQDQ